MSKNQDLNIFFNFNCFKLILLCSVWLAGGQRFEDYVFQLVLKKVIKFTPNVMKVWSHN